MARAANKPKKEISMEEALTQEALHRMEEVHF